jgi:hypothetical protein
MKDGGRQKICVARMNPSPKDFISALAQAMPDCRLDPAVPWRNHTQGIITENQEVPSEAEISQTKRVKCGSFLGSE